MNAREQFYTTLRRAVSGSEAVALPVRSEPHGQVPGDAAAVELFLQRAELHGISVQQLSAPEDAKRWLEERLRDVSWVAARHRGLVDMLPSDAAGSPQYGRGDGSTDAAVAAERETALRTAAERADVGIGIAVAAVADSGAIVLRISPDEDRCVSLLPVEHIAVLRKQDVYASLAVAVADGVFSSVDTGTHVLVGGPSRTADIEKVLVTGVHGPKAITVLLLG